MSHLATAYQLGAEHAQCAFAEQLKQAGALATASPGAPTPNQPLAPGTPSPAASYQPPNPGGDAQRALQPTVPKVPGFKTAVDQAPLALGSTVSKFSVRRGPTPDPAPGTNSPDNLIGLEGTSYPHPA